MASGILQAPLSFFVHKPCHVTAVTHARMQAHAGIWQDNRNEYEGRCPEYEFLQCCGSTQYEAARGLCTYHNSPAMLRL